MELLEAIRRITDGRANDEECFDIVQSRVRRYLSSYLTRYLANPEDREDVIVKFLTNLWEARSKLKFDSASAWWAFVTRSGRNAALDLLGRPQTVESDVEAIAANGSPSIDFIAALPELRESIYRAADEIWLGVAPEISDRERSARLLAAQLCILHQQPVEEICLILGGRWKSSSVREWVQNGETLRQLCYVSLYKSNDALTGYVLRPSEPLMPNDLQILGREALGKTGRSALPDWEWHEIRIVIWRYRNGLLTEKILQMDSTLDRETLEETLNKCAARLPFRSAAQLIADSIQPFSNARPLAEDKLYRRLVFQYCIAHELPHRQIIERVEAPAEIGGYPISEDKLNLWLSNRRILSQVICHLQGGPHAH